MAGKTSSKSTKSFGRRLGERLRSAGDFGRETIVDPAGMPGRAHGLFKRWFRRVWSVRGGGLYACGFAAAFLFFEAREIVFDDIPQLAAMNILSSELFGFIIQVVIDAIKNTVMALMWPVWIVQIVPPYGAIGLGVAFWLFPVVLKAPIERWLFDDDGFESN